MHKPHSLYLYGFYKFVQKRKIDKLTSEKVIEKSRKFLYSIGRYASVRSAGGEIKGGNNK